MESYGLQIFASNFLNSSICVVSLLVVSSLVVLLLEEDSLSVDAVESLLLEVVSWLEVELLEVVWLLHPTIKTLDKTNNFFE